MSTWATYWAQNNVKKRFVFNLLGKLLLVEAILMLPSFVISLICSDGDHWAFLISIIASAVAGFPMAFFIKPDGKQLYMREGLAVAGLGWLLLSAFGALPLYIYGACDYVSAFFEITSGFTTTGATIFTEVESLPHGILFWRSFTHWIGGMGVLVFTTALLPTIGGRGGYLARAESAGPSFSKLAPKLGDSSKILYLIYTALTVLMTICLLLAGMPLFDALIHAFGTAGTGGFSNRNLSVAAYNSPAIEIIVSVFMLLFGLNFALFFRLILRDFRGIVKNEEARVYLIIAVLSILFIAIDLLKIYDNFWTSLRYSMFQVPTIMSTSGFATADFNVWPAFSKILLLMLMLFGSCAGSTAGGLKMIRVIMLTKMAFREIRHAFQPRKVHVIKIEGKSVSEDALSGTGTFFFTYIAILLLGALIVSLDGSDLLTSVTASLACLSNIGPGLGEVGPMGNFGSFSAAVKIVLSFIMLAGRLEIFPILILFHPAAWKRS